MSNVGIERISTARRYRGEWDGECRCATAERMKHIKVKRAATGCTIRIEESDDRVLGESEKSAFSLDRALESAL